jgi:hypothetical protein
MKKLLTFLLLVAANTAFAQEIPLSIIDRINGVNFIFEGEVINSEPYYTADGGYIYTSNTVEITKILKGEIECGTIEIITKGGAIANKEIDIPHSLKLIDGSSGIFLCSETNRPHSIIDFYPESNFETLEATFENQSFIRYWWNGREINAADIWHNYDSLAQVYNVTEVISGLEFIDCDKRISNINLQSIGSNSDEEFPTYSKEAFNELINYANFKKGNYSRLKTSRNTDKIFYNLNNLTITGNTQKYLEFDITVKDNLGSKFLDFAAIRLEYNPAAFGNNVVANSNIIVTRGTLNTDPNCYSPPIPSDANSNTILIPALETLYSQCKAPILQTDQSIMHIKMKIQTCDIPNDIALVDTATLFIPSLILDYSAYAEYPADTFQTYYQELDHNQVKSVNSCEAKISDFWPKEVGGGIKDTLTIQGFQFGNTRGNGNLYFKNANDGGVSEVFLDSLDYILWSDTLIKIHVPSYDSTKIAGIAYSGEPAGTGFFRIINDLGEVDTSNAEIKIKFSVAIQDTKKPYIIAPRDTFNKKITFHCSEAVANYKSGAMKEVIRKAIDDWVCLTGINWELGSDLIYNDSIAKDDSICIITFSKLSSNTIASASVYKGSCPIPDNPAVFYEMDIEIDTTNLFLIDILSTSIPAGHFDFYSIILHELGHCHNLKHVIGSNHIMHAGILPQQIRRDLENDYSCDEGGNWMIDFSTDTINNLINSCNVSNITANPFTPCSHLSIQVLEEQSKNIKIYPNPFNDNITITFNDNYNEEINLRMFDITGKLVIHEKYFSLNKEKSIILNTNRLMSGIFIINIQGDRQLQSFKLIKNGH